MNAYKVIENLKATAETRTSLFGPQDSSVKLALEMAEAVESLTDHAERLGLALEDAISTYREDDKTVLVTAERQEAWIDVLGEYRAAFLSPPPP